MSDTHFNALDEAFLSVPGPIFSKLRRASPVLRHDLGSERVVSIFSYELAKWILDKDGQLVSVQLEDDDALAAMSEGLSYIDPPTHTSLRKLVTPCFIGRSLSQWRPQIAASNDVALEALFRQNEPVDFVAAYADPFTAAALALFLGFPDRSIEFAAHSLILEESFGYGFFDTDLAARMDAKTLSANTFLHDYVKRAWEQAGPSDSGLIGDLKKLIAHNPSAVSKAMAVGLLTETIGAGFVTVAGAMTNLLHLLMTNPDQYALLQCNRDLIRAAIEEAFRLEPPLRFMNRKALSDFSLGGCEIKTGDTLLLWIMACNRDPQIFEEPDTFRLDRPNNQHIVFGHGAHRCIGLNIARVQIELMLSTLLNRNVIIEPFNGDADIRRNSSPFLNRIDSMQVAFKEA